MNYEERNSTKITFQNTIMLGIFLNRIFNKTSGNAKKCLSFEHLNTYLMKEIYNSFQIKLTNKSKKYLYFLYTT